MKCKECNKELTMGEMEYYEKSVRPSLKLPRLCRFCGVKEIQDLKLKKQHEL